jgi:hypothetical protein
MIMPAAVLAALLIMMSVVHAEEAQSQRNCAPWPACSVVKSSLNPGTPTHGIRPQGKVAAATPHKKKSPQ